MDFVRALREMGASSVRVGDVVVTFGAPYVSQDDALTRSELSAEERERRAEEDLYWSAEH